MVRKDQSTAPEAALLPDLPDSAGCLVLMIGDSEIFTQRKRSAARVLIHTKEWVNGSASSGRLQVRTYERKLNATRTSHHGEEYIMQWGHETAAGSSPSNPTLHSQSSWPLSRQKTTNQWSWNLLPVPVTSLLTNPNQFLL